MTFDISGFTKPQKNIFLSLARFRVVVAGRRFGKTTLSVSECLYAAQTNPYGLIWYIAPTYRQAKELVWDAFKDCIPQSAIKNKNESELSITLKGFNSKIALKGADNPDSLRGKGLKFVVFDEAADIHKDTWYKVIYPALTDNKGHALFIGTPKGYNWFYDLHLFAHSSPNWEAFSYTTAQGGNVSLDELEYAKATLNPKSYKQEFEASFETLANRVYCYFERNLHVDSSIEDMGAEIHIGMDFNVDPMSAVLASKVGNQLHIFDEIEIPNGNTMEMCRELKSRFPNRKIIVYPDPSGKSRKTSSEVGQTDFTILRGHGFQVLSHNAAPLVVDRINEVNSLFENAKKERRLFINPKCQSLIKCLEGLTYKEKTSIPDKGLGLDHLPDALGYMVNYLFPINSRQLKELKVLGL